MIVAGVGPTSPILQQTSRTVPIVMAQTIDPVGAGFVQSLARPGGNMTGFTQFEYDLGGKWFELLREIAPQVARVGVVRDTQGGPAEVGQWAVIRAFASPLGVELIPINITVAGETERDVSAFARSPNSGLIVCWHGRTATTQVAGFARSTTSLADDLPLSLIRRGGRSYVVWTQCGRSLQARS